MQLPDMEQVSTSDVLSNNP